MGVLESIQSFEFLWFQMYSGQNFARASFGVKQVYESLAGLADCDLLLMGEPHSCLAEVPSAVTLFSFKSSILLHI